MFARVTPPLLEIVHLAGPAWVQDRGRPGRMADGVPPGGALVPERLAEANAGVGNAGSAAAVECFGSVVVAARGGDLRIAWDGAASVLPRDHVRTLTAGGPVAYLAVAGGIDVPVVIGGRGLLAVAALGGGVGRPLRAGDRLPVGLAGAAPGAGGGAPCFDPDAPIRVVAGPDAPAFGRGWETFLGAAWTIGVGDRVGTRLVGLAVPHGHARAEAPRGGVAGGSPPAPRNDRSLSTPMVRGAVQVPGGGAPIVLGPDHPTTGGYPVIAVVITADHGALAARPVGAPVRFVAVGIEEARVATAAWRARWDPESSLPGAAGGPGAIAPRGGPG